MRRFSLLILVAGCSGSSIPQGLEVPTAQGSVRGAMDGMTRVFRGIPYAAPPTGENRWRPPKPAVMRSGVSDATEFGFACPQFQATGGAYDDKTGEDCLTLNVWTPDAPRELRPVMVWIHGGAFTLGTGRDVGFDGRNLSEGGGVVVVTINYRLGPLGFLAHAALTAEDPEWKSSGNYGLLDQQEALRWIRENIGKFGGDPANVTIFGESAGGISVCDQLVAPAAAGLFHRAIIESGPCMAFPLPARAVWEAQGEVLAQALACAGDAKAVRDCMRAKSAKEVLTALPPRKEVVFGDGYGWNPNVDGVVLPESPLALFQGGKFAKVPIIVGANRDEGTIFFALGTVVDTEADMRKVLGTFYSPAQVDKLVTKYGTPAFPTVKEGAIQALGDVFVCDARRVARLTSPEVKVYQYHFTRAFAWIFPNLGAFHSAEIPFVFGNPYVFIDLKEEERPLSKAVQGYWTRFAATGDPGGTPAWPPYQTATDGHLALDLTITTGTGLRAQACDFWDQL